MDVAKAGPIIALLVAGCSAPPPQQHVRGLRYAMDGGPQRAAESMRQIVGGAGNRAIDVWFEVTPPGHCEDPALLLSNATALHSAELDGKSIDVKRSPYGLMPLSPGRPVQGRLRLEGRLDRSQGDLLVGCQHELVTRWLTLDVVQFVVSGVLLLAGLFAGAIAASRRSVAFGWLALFMASTGWVSFAQSPGFRNILFVPSLWVSWLRDLVAFLYTVAFSGFVANVFGDTKRGLFRAVSLLGATLAVVAAALDVAHLVGLRRSFVASQLLVLVFLPIAVAHVWGRARAGEQAARRFLMGVVALLVFSTPDVFWGLGLPFHFEFNLTPIGLVLFSAALGSSAVATFEERSRALERTNRELGARLEEIGKKQREIRDLSGELRHQIGQRSRELERALLNDDRLTDVGITALPPSQVIGRYRVVRALGAGAMGTVHEVERIGDGARLALKVMSGAASPAQGSQPEWLASRGSPFVQSAMGARG